jgi:hypothetical protein
MTKLNIAGIEYTVPSLAKGQHRAGSGELCAAEMIAFVAGEEHSDHPECGCPVFCVALRAGNDRIPDDLRDEIMLPLVWEGLGSRSTRDIEVRRGFVAADWAVRRLVPFALRAVGMLEQATALERLGPIVDRETAFKGRDAAACVRTAADAVSAAYAAEDAAEDAAYAAAYAAEDAAYAAASAAASAAVSAAAYTARPGQRQAWLLYQQMMRAMLAVGERQEVDVAAVQKRAEKLRLLA